MPTAFTRMGAGRVIKASSRPLMGMRKDLINILCCPLCRGPLALRAFKSVGDEVLRGLLACRRCGQEYPIIGGIPDLLPPVLLYGEDLRWMEEYDRMARGYYLLFHVVLPALSLWAEVRTRAKWVSKLGLRPGQKVLDVGTGTGRNLPFLRELVGPEGLVVGMDISRSMLYYAVRLARAKGWRNVELQRANAAYLPYKDGVFDAVIHVGGINTFEEKARALSEMMRVAKPGARIVVVDEGLKPKMRKTFLGRFLLRTNILYASFPPVDELPDDAKGVKVSWGLLPSRLLPLWPYYVMEFRKP